jgi:hypothetical protein
MTQAKLIRRGLIGSGVALVGAGASLGRILRAGGARATSTQTLTVGTNMPFTTLDPNTINTSAFPFRNSVFDALIDIPVVDIATYKLATSRPRWRPVIQSVTTTPKSGCRFGPV